MANDLFDKLVGVTEDSHRNFSNSRLCRGKSYKYVNNGMFGYVILFLLGTDNWPKSSF